MQSGDYLLRVSDRFRQSGDRHFYVATARVEATDFELSVPTDVLIVAPDRPGTVSYTHLRAHETPEHLVCRLLLEKKKKKETKKIEDRG